VTSLPSQPTAAPDTSEPAGDAIFHGAALTLSSTEGDAVFRDLVSYLAASLGVDVAFVALPVAGESCRMRMLAFYVDGRMVEDFEYPIAGTPCETVLGQDYRIYPSGLQERFPLDIGFKKMGLECYAGYPLSDAHGAPLGLIAVVARRSFADAARVESMLKIFGARVVTEIERKRADAALRASEQRYRLLFEMESDALLLIDVASLRIIDANHAAERLYGYAREELLDLAATELSVEPDLTARTIHLQSGAGRVPLRFHRRKDGSVFPVEIANNPIDLGGRPTMLAAIRDITQRVEQEEALRRSEARLRATVEAAFDCVIGMDLEGRVIEFNAEAQRVFGYARADVLGKPLAPLIIPERFREAHTAGMARFRATGHASVAGRRMDVVAMRADGSEFPAELAIEVAEAPEGRIFVASLRDVAERHRAEEARNQLEAQLRQAQKMEAIGHLAGGIAHDFNNILTSIMGYVALAADRTAVRGDPKLAHYLDQAQSAVHRARDLIRQMLTFSRGQRGAPRPLLLAQGAADSAKLLRSTLPSSIELSTELRNDLPRALLDPVHLEQVLLNLCINARDAMQNSGSIRVTLDAIEATDRLCASCRQRIAGPYLALAVTDTGPGIAPEVLDRMFEPFFTTKEVGKGSGMGLATVHGIVHEYGGHIEVETAPARGSTFRVLFPPLRENGAAASESALEADEPEREQASLRGRVLVVDDETMVAQLMHEMLAGWGLETTVLRNPVEAEAWFMQNPQRVDLVLSDYTMPKITGLELAQRLTLVRPDLPVLLYSGFGTHIDPADAARSGVSALIAKPVEPKVLFGILREHLPQAGSLPA
jgi:PAS domain S-box-containing protein